MGDWAALQVNRYAKSDAAGVAGTTVTAGSPANVKGSWTELFASTSIDAEAILVEIQLTPGAGNNRHYAFDIGVGGAGSEVVAVSDITLYNNTAQGGNEQGCPILIPVFIPAGTRISMRSQSDLASSTANVRVHILKGGFANLRQMGRATTYGFNAGSTTGTTVTTGVANTKGAYAQLTASMTNSCRWLILVIGVATGTSQNFSIDVAIGAASSEQIIVPDLYYTSGNSGPSVMVFQLPLAIPAGQRLAVRAASGGATQSFEITAIGVD